MNNQEYDKLKTWIKSVDDKLDNHLVGVGKEMAEMKTDMSWIKRFFWLIAASSIGALFTALISLILWLIREAI